ncbi:protein disulfide-isomerase [Wolinella succinogenes]|uniref:PROTEIN DISULPHIDE ISOMERASE n=1 Tax=Wolinella succinogenes (strain ATCC 29543 / DSM 1740 / CCUG 13145 / JCM 31913 / LMG 7466 / NCTC 11488 / FDC 602W) TaxID=273121 RepID=Q7M8B9_WOLSU|nr:protein disulfide-isomerase [Wolinella succinogenes]CAE10769.1 PROTEIN DISULPHIDE ISOMERASE [Wolinella succinogenes]VEG80925.1 Protein-disulfide isomerase [Wolinella succinogenes]HCZ18147.1 hypothetical protein [Helicobacter sp.]
MTKTLLKVALASSLVASLALAKSFEENLEALVQTKTGMPIKVVKSYELEGFKEMKFVSVESATSGQRFPLFASLDGNNIIGFSNLFFTQNAKNDEIVQNAIKEIQNFNETAKGKKLNEIFKSIPENRYVNLKSTGNNVKKTLVVVTDPECPYCRNEMKTIEEKLKDHHIKIILAPVGARTAFVKSQIAMDKIKEAKSDKEKISILREVYADSYKIPENLRNQPTKLIDENAEKIYSSGLIRGVPFVFEME